MRGKEKRTACQRPTERSGTRDAVETAIDRAKGDKVNTWENVSRGMKKTVRWQTRETTSGRDDDTRRS
jgi:hypothetical protein